MPTTSVGNSASFAILAKQVIVEINLTMPLAMEGLHDIFIPTYRPHRQPIPLISPEQRIGTPFISIDPSKIAAIVITERPTALPMCCRPMRRPTPSPDTWMNFCATK